MKLFFLVAALGVTALAAAPQPASRSPEGDPTVEEIQTIRKILELPPERLARMRSSIEKIERLTPEARREFAANLAKYESATPEERHKIMKEMRERGGFAARVLEYHFKALNPAEAKAERARIQALTPEQRMELIHKLAEKYGPELAKEKGKLGEGKDGEKGGMKRRKAPEGKGPDGPPPVVAPKQ